MKRIILFLSILILAAPAFGSSFDIEYGLSTDSLRISEYLKLHGTTLDSIWVSGDSLYFSTDGTVRGFPRVMSGSGLGDVVGPGSAVDEDIVLFDGTTGKLIKDSGVKISDLGGGTTNADSLNHILVTAPAPATGNILRYNGTAWVNTAKPSFLDSLFMATGKPIMFGAVLVKDTLGTRLRGISAMYDSLYTNTLLPLTPNTGQLGTSGNAWNSVFGDSLYTNPNIGGVNSWVGMRSGTTASSGVFISSDSSSGLARVSSSFSYTRANNAWLFTGAITTYSPIYGGSLATGGAISSTGGDVYSTRVGGRASADTLKANKGLSLRTTMLDSIWTANDSLKIYIGGELYGFPQISAGGGYTDEQAQDAVGGMVTGSLVYVDETPSLQLSGDATSPGNTKLYGTDGAGTKGWYDQPSGAGVPATTVQGETSYGISSAVGTATSYAREDHTHGTPATTKDKTAITGILKGNGTDVSAATAGTDYENALTFSSPLSRAVNTISIPAATTSVNGYLTSTDWNTFNGKEAVLTFNSPLSRTTNTVSLTTVGNTLGGTGQNSSAWSGIPKVTAGTWSVATASTDYVVPGDLANYLHDVGGSATGNHFVMYAGDVATTVSDQGYSASSFIASTEKAAASGVASLSAASLVVQNPANATATPTASKIPIADGSGKLAAGWGGAASTLATLNASTLVVENPANATATATATKIPISDGSAKLDTWVSNSSETVAGKVELATSAEINTGTDATRAISPDALAGSRFGKKAMQAYIIQATTAVTTGDGKGYMVIDSTLAGMNVIAIGASLIGAASSSGTPTIQIARGRQASATTAHAFNDVLSTRITIDALEWSSKDATTPSVINATYDDLLLGDLLRIDVDVAGTGAQGLIITVTGMLP